jgi:hypothetical protein
MQTAQTKQLIFISVGLGNVLSEHLLAGESAPLSLPAGEYYARILDCRGIPHRIVRFQSSAEPAILVGGVNKVPLLVQNAAATEVCSLQAPPTNDAGWGDDLLSAGETLRSGEFRYFHFYPHTYRLRAMACDGGEIAATHLLIPTIPSSGTQAEQTLSWRIGE